MISFEHNKKLTVINLLGGPGCGKSSVAHFLMGHMKARGYKVEFVHEFAKDCVWENGHHDPHNAGGVFTEQDYMLANQHRMIRRLVDKDIEYVVTDTSMLLGLIYAPEWYPSTFAPFLMDVYNSYNNVNVLIDRGDIPYVEVGRNETAAQATQKDNESLQMLHKHDIPFYTVRQEMGKVDAAALQILDIIK